MSLHSVPNDTAPNLCWEHVGSTALLGSGRESSAVDVYCYRTPNTDLATAQFRIEVDGSDGATTSIDCTQADLIGLAKTLLHSALHAWPMRYQAEANEIITRGYFHPSSGEVA